MCVAYTHSSSNTSEEDAKKQILEWVKSTNLLENKHDTRLFGRNTDPTNNPEPHGYELYLTVSPNYELEDIEMREIAEGLYAGLRFTNLKKIREAWVTLW